MRSLVLIMAGACMAGTPGCSDPNQVVGFQESDPAARLRAVREAAETNDRSAIGPLIEMLDSDDPAERLLAIRTLEKLTGQTFGYDHAAPRAERDEAVGRWVSWYRQQQGLSGGKAEATAAPAASPPLPVSDSDTGPAKAR